MNAALAALEGVAAAHARALARAALAGDRRARAAFEAREAGASWGQIASALGVARANVPALVARGAGLASLEAAPVAAVASRVTPPAATGDAVPAPGAARCLREGCPLEAGPGARFCPAHRWS